MTCQPCCVPQRLELVARAGTANGIEWVEVLDVGAPPGVPRQQTLFVRLLLPAPTLSAASIVIDGGSRIADVGIVWAGMGDALPAAAEPAIAALVTEPARTLVIRTDSNGDFSRYRLRLVAGLDTTAPPAGFDPVLAETRFSFKVECPTEFDCADALPCPPAPVAKPDIDYLVKDYPGFRRLMLDRLGLLAPGWTERSPADVGVTLVELLAYAADQLSYRQDVIANEAYLATARQRISVRRHARLVDYRLHEGSQARAFVHLRVLGANVPLPRHTRLLTRSPGLQPELAPGPNEEAARRAGALVFETAHAVTLHDALNELAFHTWGDLGCSLPRGATRATLKTHCPGLAAGDFLLLQELRSPTLFTLTDADRMHRHIVRLTRVTRSSDPAGRLFEPEPVNGPLDVTEVEWDSSDALPFPLCLGVASRPGLVISLARGNLVLADHGLSVAGPAGTGEDLGTVREPTRRFARDPAAADCCTPQPAPTLPLRYRPTLREQPLSHGYDLAALIGAPLQPDQPERWWSAAALRKLAPRDAMPQVSGTGQTAAGTDTWLAQRDLLSSLADDRHFAVEVDDAQRARLRFGDDRNGRRPDDGTQFRAFYRVGNGSSGNVGAEAIAHIVTSASGMFEHVENPMPAFGGSDAEDIEAARRDAPQAFRTQERAVTAADYEAAAERKHDVQRAAASFRWTGSWHTVFVSADRRGGVAVDDRFEARLRAHLERFRMAGYDLEVNGPRPVPLDVALFVCVKAGHFRADVQRAVQRELSSALLSDGRRGVFHPDNFSFGEPVYASRIVAAAQAVAGVDSVKLEVFRRLVNPSPTSLAEGVIRVGRLEIAQLSNDPSFRERGRLVLRCGGGQ
jgi:Baseplate J-like protein